MNHEMNLYSLIIIMIIRKRKQDVIDETFNWTTVFKTNYIDMCEGYFE